MPVHLFPIQADKEELLYVPGAGILDSKKTKRFWISWDSKNLMVGEGYPDTTPFMHYSPTSGSLGQINVIGFTSDGISEAEWTVPQDQGNNDFRF